MSAERTGRVELSVRADPGTVRTLLEEFFTARGWRVAEQAGAPDPGLLEVETGSLRRTVLLGALAGRGAHLRARLELAEEPGGTRVVVRRSERAGRALGGLVGAARARRLHTETAEALTAHLREQGLLHETAPEE